MDSELVTSQNGGEKQYNHDGDGRSMGEIEPEHSTAKERKALGGRQGTG